VCRRRSPAAPHEAHRLRGGLDGGRERLQPHGTGGLVEGAADPPGGATFNDRPTTRPALDRAPIEVVVRERLGNWRGLLTAQVQDGRGLLRQILTGPIQFTRVKQGAVPSLWRVR